MATPTAFRWYDCQRPWAYFKVTGLFHIKFFKNGVWYGKSYYRLLIGNHTLALDWYHFWWPWSTFEGHFSLGCHFRVNFSNLWHAFASHGLPAIAELLVTYCDVAGVSTWGGTSLAEMLWWLMQSCRQCVFWLRYSRLHGVTYHASCSPQGRIQKIVLGRAHRTWVAEDDEARRRRRWGRGLGVGLPPPQPTYGFGGAS